MIVFDRDGQLSCARGARTSSRRGAWPAHGARRQRSTALTKGDPYGAPMHASTGKVLLQIGVFPESPAPADERRALPSLHALRRCPPRGDIYVADGYGNAQARSTNIRPDGKLLMSWGEPRHPTRVSFQSRPQTSAAIVDGWVYVARSGKIIRRPGSSTATENYEGAVETNPAIAPCGPVHSPAGERKPICYIGGSWAPDLCGQHGATPNLGARAISIVTQ